MSEESTAVATVETKAVELKVGDPVKGPEGMMAIAKQLCHPEQETFVVACLDCQSNLLSSQVVALGTVDQVQVSVRDIYREAIRKNAWAIAALHNHPSGDATPSQPDEDCAMAVAEAGRLLGIRVLDVAVVALGEKPKYLSILGELVQRQALKAFGEMLESAHKDSEGDDEEEEGDALKN
jgi:DNA repair protein RadC